MTRKNAEITGRKEGKEGKNKGNEKGRKKKVRGTRQEAQYQE